MNRLFFSRTPRERVFIVGFLLAAGIAWLASAGGRVQTRWRERGVVSADLSVQQLWLGRKAAIEERATRAAGRLNPERTLDATRLAGEVSAIATRLGLAVAVEPPRTERTNQFAYHTVQVSFRHAELGALVKYYRELGQRAPYLALEKCALGANRSNPAELDAVFTIFSVEAVH